MMGKIEALTLENFTAFDKASFEFCPGINVLIGTNGIGKTHVIKSMYAVLKVLEEVHLDDETYQTIDDLIYHKLRGVFQFSEIRELIRQRSYPEQQRFPQEELAYFDYLLTAYYGLYGKQEALAYLKYDYTDLDLRLGLDEPKDFQFEAYAHLKYDSSVSLPAPIYLPTREFLSINQGFISTYRRRELHFDETYYDLGLALDAMPLRSNELEDVSEMIDVLKDILIGQDTKDDVIFVNNGHFYFNLPEGFLSSHFVAEGYRKIATLLYLLRNGSLTKNSILFWDEPEANLNPKLVVQVVQILQKLAAAGMQIFIATHDYLLSYELSLLAEYPTQDAVEMKFFALHRPDRRSGVEVEAGDTMGDLQHNPIVEEFAAHYDRQVLLYQKELDRGEALDAAIFMTQYFTEHLP